MHDDIAAVLSGEKRWCVVTGDCLDVLSTLPDRCVDAIVTDPPYGVGVKYRSFDDTRDNVRNLITKSIPLMTRASDVVLLTPGNGNQWLYPEPTWELAWIEPAGSGRSPWGFQCWHPILAYGKCPYLSAGMGGRPDIFDARWDKPHKSEHPCPKPPSVMRWMVKRATVAENTVVCDPFTGDGTTGAACVSLGRRFIGIEIDEKYADIARRRIQDADTHLFASNA